MPYSKITDHEKNMYASAVMMVAQQRRDPFAGAVTDIAASGQAMSASDIFGAVEAVYGEDRTRSNFENPVTGTRRWLVRPPVIKSGQYIDEEDKFDTAMDPTSNYVMAHTMAVRRKIGDRTVGVQKDSAGYFRVVDGGILGGAISGKAPGGAPTALPGTQVVPVGSTGLTIDKLRDALLVLRKADFGLEDDDPLYGFIAPDQIDDLLAIAQASGNALNAFNVEQLRTGKPSPLMGVTWLMSNRVPFKDGSTTVRLVPIFAKRNIVRGFWEQLNGSMWNDTSADNKPYCRVRAYVDCVRLEDKGVVAIECQQ